MVRHRGTRAPAFALALLTVAGSLGCGQAMTARGAVRAAATLDAVQRIDVALRVWRRERGTLPEGTAEEVVRTLAREKNSAGEPFLFLPSTVHLRGGGQDAWDREIVVRIPGTRGDGPADVYSIGENGKDEGGAGDDVSAWNGFDAAAYSRLVNPVDTGLVGLWVAVIAAVLAAGLVTRARRSLRARAREAAAQPATARTSATGMPDGVERI